jgi:thiamine-phosphate diphosphorylase
VTTRRLLCLVTDRRRLAERAGRAASDALPLLVAQIEGAIRGGIDLVQIREHDLDTRLLSRLVRHALHLAEGTSARVIVNDRVDVAVATGAHGVHLRELSFSGRLIKQRWPSLMIGRSVHSRDAMSRDAGVEYWIAGTVFPTESKPSGESMGAEGLGRLVQAAGSTPVLAIGGITEATLPLIVASGATGVAAIGAFLPPAGAGDLVAAVEKRVETLRFAFDTASAVP